VNAAVGVALAACLGGSLELQPDSTIDYGWTRRAHHQILTSGSATGFVVVSRCSDDASLCTTNAECGNQDCVPTCNCSDDTTCEITGPIGQKHCLGTLTDSSTNQDCVYGGACVSEFTPPMPFAGWVPTCVESYFDGPLTGTIDVATGQDVGSEPCFGSSDCLEGKSCVAGSGRNWDLNAAQLEPNDCAADGLRCGGAATETCEGRSGACTGVSPQQTYVANADCEEWPCGGAEIK
jgi:hypothetical protein